MKQYTQSVMVLFGSMCTIQGRLEHWWNILQNPSKLSVASNLDAKNIETIMKGKPFIFSFLCFLVLGFALPKVINYRNYRQQRKQQCSHRVQCVNHLKLCVLTLQMYSLEIHSKDSGKVIYPESLPALYKYAQEKGILSSSTKSCQSNIFSCPMQHQPYIYFTYGSIESIQALECLPVFCEVIDNSTASTLVAFASGRVDKYDGLTSYLDLYKTLADSLPNNLKYLLYVQCNDLDNNPLEGQTKTL